MLKYKTISWIAVIVWMGLIFYLSHQPATVSNELSTGVTEIIVKIVGKVISYGNFDMGSFNHIIRKNAHFLMSSSMVLG